MSRAVLPAQALLVVDIGNTRIGMAVWDDDGLHPARRVPSDQPDAWGSVLGALWSETRGAAGRAVVVASVRADATRRFLDLAGDVCGSEPFVVRDDLPLPLVLEIENEQEVGVDRVCSAAAAYDRIQGACAVASFGTAITIDCVSNDGRFLGGAILPGLSMCYDALHARTAALPRVAGGVPRGPFGRNTEEAITNGVMFGAAGALREVVERFASELGRWPQLVLTGGDAPLIASLVDFADSIVPDLCLIGAGLAYRKACGQA